MTDDLASVIDDCDVIIDFSTKEAAMEVLDLAVAHGKGAGVRHDRLWPGGNEPVPPRRQRRSLCCMRQNTSKMVNVMNKLLEMVVNILKDDVDVEILEMHDQWKKDAPSGTSKEMGEIMAHAMGKELSDIAVYGREGASPRVPGTIGYHSLRAGQYPQQPHRFLWRHGRAAGDHPSFV